MDIREAIEKAGPGGKIRRTCWKMALCWSLGDYIGIEDTEEPDRGLEIFTSNLTATDWEVVTEECIEVGDIGVDRGEEQGGCHSNECRVVDINNDYPVLSSMTSHGCACVIDPNQFKLIRKGGKRHVFEGATFLIGAEEPTATNKAVTRFLNESEGNGKTYDITFTEKM